MQKNLFTSRNICQDKFWNKMQDQNYKTHQKRVKDIHKKSHPSLHQFSQTKRITNIFHKSKSTSNKFKQSETDTEIKKQNEILLMKMKFIGNDGNSVQKVMYRSGSNWTFRKRENEQIRRENNKFVNCIKDNLIKPDEFKKKMNKEIREYLDRKNQIRKCKYISKGQLPNNMNLKLHSENNKQDNEEREQELNQLKQEEKKDNQVEDERDDSSKDLKKEEQEINANDSQKKEKANENMSTVMKNKENFEQRPLNQQTKLPIQEGNQENKASYELY